MGHGNKNDANIFYHLRGDNLLLYMPFPSVTELAQYKITHGSSSSEYETNKFNSSYVPITEENLSVDNSKETKKKYDVIGTNKDGPYRSGETNLIRSTK